MITDGPHAARIWEGQHAFDGSHTLSSVSSCGLLQLACVAPAWPVQAKGCWGCCIGSGPMHASGSFRCAAAGEEGVAQGCVLAAIAGSTPMDLRSQKPCLPGVCVSGCGVRACTCWV